MKLVVLSVLIAAGCGRIDFDAPVDSNSNVSPGFCAQATFSLPAASSVQDDFSVAPFTDRWGQIGTCTAQTAGALVMTPSTTMTEYCYVFTKASYHLTCDSVLIKVPVVTQPVLGAQTFIYIVRDNQALLSVLMEGTGFQMGWFGKTEPVAFSDYVAGRDAWWRLRELDGETIFETAPDGAAWVERMRARTEQDLSNVEIDFGAGTYMPVAAPEEAQFRCYNRPPPCS